MKGSPSFIVRACVVLLGGAALAAASVAAQSMPNTLSAKERAEGWRLLFDGKTAAGWRGYKQQTLPAGWKAIDGALTRVGQAGDIVTVDEFGNFELTLEWKLAPNGNSGVFYRVVEDDPVMWHMAPEYQIIDNAYKEPLKPGQYAAANYDLDPPSRDVTKPIGSWNLTRIVARGAHVEHWLNGVKVVEYELGSPAMQAALAASKFKSMAWYAQRRTGHIVLQDHGDDVWIRNMKIRELNGR